MEKKSRKEFKELSEEQLKEVTGGVSIVHAECIIDPDNPCPSHKLDSDCNCIG